MRLTLVSLMAPNADFFYRELAAYLRATARLDLQVVDDIPWQERERLLDRGEAHVGFICGLPYARKAAAAACSLELLAAPVMRAPRYGGRPVYFSDVVVRRDSPFRSFADLRGGSWAYNEPGSQSGYNITRWHLARLGERRGYFGRVVEAGAHQAALRMVVDGAVDASAIDSTVLALELSRRPELASRLRIIDTLGPSTIPPAVISRRVPAPVRAALRQALLAMHEDAEGCRLLDSVQYRRFTRVEDRDYDDIRRMAREAAAVPLEAHPSSMDRRPGGYHVPGRSRSRRPGSVHDVCRGAACDRP